MANDYFLMTETTTTISVCSSPAEEAEAIGDVVKNMYGFNRETHTFEVEWDAPTSKPTFTPA